MTREEELLEVKTEIVKLEHQLKLVEMQQKFEYDMKLEEARRETLLLVEEKRKEANLQQENTKGKWALGTGLLGIAVGAGVACLANSASISQRDMDRNIANRKLFGGR